MICFSLELNVDKPCMLRITWWARGIKDYVHTMTRLSALLKKTNTASHKVFHPPHNPIHYCEAEHYPITSKLHLHPPFVFLNISKVVVSHNEWY